MPGTLLCTLSEGNYSSVGFPSKKLIHRCLDNLSFGVNNYDQSVIRNGGELLLVQNRAALSTFNARLVAAFPYCHCSVLQHSYCDRELAMLVARGTHAPPTARGPRPVHAVMLDDRGGD
jgi:hypothetical protein